MTDDERIDLGALDPARDPARLERSARAITARVAPVLAARRAQRADAWALLAAWRRPVLAAAAAIVVISVVTLVRTPRPAARAATAATVVATTGASNTSLSEAAGLPGAVASYVEADVPPSPSNHLSAPLFLCLSQTISEEPCGLHGAWHTGSHSFVVDPQGHRFWKPRQVQGVPVVFWKNIRVHCAESCNPQSACGPRIR